MKLLLFKYFSAMRIVGILFTVNFLFIPSQGLSYTDDEFIDYNSNKNLNFLSTRSAVERVPLQFEK